MYLKAEGIERQERLQYLRQTRKSSIWSEEDDDSYMLPDPEIPLVYSLHYGQQCPPEWNDGSLGARFGINVKVEYPKPKRIVFLPSAILVQFWFLLVFENLHFFTLSTGDRLRTL